MLKPIKTKTARASGGTFAIVASRYNADYVDAMLRAAREELLRAGAHVRIVRVPGAFEIPGGGGAAGATGTLRGHHLPRRDFSGRDQPRAAHRRGVTHALAQIQVLQKIPVIHGVFVLEKVKQAKVRCLGKKHNRGTEAAQTALEMARVMKSLRG